MNPRNHVLDGVRIPIRKGAIFRAKRSRPRTCPTVDILKRLNRGQHGYGVDADLGVLDGGALHIDATW